MSVSRNIFLIVCVYVSAKRMTDGGGREALRSARVRSATYVNNSEDLGDRGALPRELAIDRRVLALDTLAQSQQFSVVTQSRGLQVRLPFAHVDQPFQLVA